VRSILPFGLFSKMRLTLPHLAILWMCFLVGFGMLAYSATGIRFNDGLSKTFRGTSEAYLRYVEFTEVFGDDTGDVLVLVEQIDLTNPEQVTLVENLAIEFQFIDNIGSILSPFSFSGADGAPLFPQVLLPKQEMAERFEAARDASPVLSQFWVPEVEMLVLLIGIEDPTANAISGSTTIANIKEVANSFAETSKLKISLTGLPIIRDSLISKLIFNLILINAIGLTVGTIIATLAFANLELGLIVAASAGVSVVCSAGFVAMVGFELNVITIALPTVVLVLSFADSTHLVLDIKYRYLKDEKHPIFEGARAMFPATGLAALTTAIAFGSLVLSPSILVSQLGIAGFLGTLVSTAAGFLFLPLAIFTAVQFVGVKKLMNTHSDYSLGRRLLLNLVLVSQGRTVAAAWGGAIAVVLTLVMFLRLEPNFSIYEGLAESDPELMAVRTMETSIGPIGALNYEHSTLDPTAFENAAQALENLSDRQVTSYLSAGDMLDEMPELLRTRLLDDDGKTGVVTVAFDYNGSRALERQTGDLDARLKADGDAKGFAPVNGFYNMSAVVSSEILNAMKFSFLISVCICGLLIALWTGNVLIGFISLIPNILPITGLGTVLFLIGDGLSYTSAIVFTVAIGIVFDDTIHVLNRLRLRSAETFSSEDVVAAATQASPAIGITTLVLCSGMVGMLFSPMPNLVLFGQFAIIIFVFALVLDTVLLPALLTLASRYAPAHLLRFRK